MNHWRVETDIYNLSGVMEAGEFPVGRLLNGDSYKSQTRMKNISSAMTWIQKQLESLRESDKQLFSLFNKLELDMADLKAICNEGGRYRTSSASSIGGLLTRNQSNDMNISFDKSSFMFDTSVKILEEDSNTGLLEHSDSCDSLQDFADELGLDDDEPEDLPSLHSKSNGRVSIKSQGSNMSSEINFSISLPSTKNQTLEEEPMDTLSITSHSSGSSTRLHGYSGSPHLSQTGINETVSHSSDDSGAMVDDLSTTGTETTGSSNNTTRSDVSSVETGLTTTVTEDRRLSGLAGEIFALLNMN